MNDQSRMSDGQSTKRAFKKPTLRVYGTVGEITRSVGKKGKMDGGGPKSNNKTILT